MLAGLVFVTARFFERYNRSMPITSLVILLVSAGGFAANDIADLRRDKINTPTRPLPSGTLTTREAAISTISCFALALAFSAEYLDRYRLSVVSVYVVSLALYSRLSDLIPLYKNIYVAALIASFALFGLTPGSYSTCAVTFATVVFLFVFSGEVSGDVYDEKGDRLTFRRTIPVLWGQQLARDIVVATNVFLLGMLLQTMRTCHCSSLFVIVGSAAGLLNMAAVVGVVAAVLSKHSFQICLEVEKYAIAMTIVSFLLTARG